MEGREGCGQAEGRIRGRVARGCHEWPAGPPRVLPVAFGELRRQTAEGPKGDSGQFALQ